MSDNEAPKPKAKSERFSTAVTVLIALVSTVIALVASQAAVQSGNATEAQHNGVIAKINLERVDGGTRVQIARNRRAFSTYHFNRRLYTITFEYVTRAEAGGSSPHGTRLRQEAAAHLEESNSAWQFIDSGYLIANDNGDYVDFDEQTFLNDGRQRAAIYQDIDFEDNFAEADAMRTEGLALNASLLGWFISLLFLTWAEITKSALRWVWLGAGLVIALGLLVLYTISGLAGMLGV